MDHLIEKMEYDIQQRVERIYSSIEGEFPNELIVYVKDFITFFYISAKDKDKETIINDLKTVYSDFNFNLTPFIEKIISITIEQSNTDIDYIHDLAATYAEEETEEYECDEFGDKPLTDDLEWELMSCTKDNILKKIDIKLCFTKLNV